MNRKRPLQRDKSNKANLKIGLLTAGALLIVFYLVFHQHETTKAKVLSQFSENQLLNSRQIAKPMERYFRSRSQDLRWLAYLIAHNDFDKKRISEAIQANLKRLNMTHIQEVSLLNTKGMVVYSTTSGDRGKDHSHADFFTWAKQPENRNAVRMWHEKADISSAPVYAGSPIPSRIDLFLTAPVYKESAPGSPQMPDGNFAGALVFKVDLKKMLAERSPQLLQEDTLRNLWIIDRSGTLLLHSNHPEMVMKDISKNDQTCNQCHSSFNYVEAILGKSDGTLIYQIKGESRKIAAFSSMSFENASWIIVMNAPLDEVTAFESEDFEHTLVLLGTVVFLLGLAFFFAYKNYRQKVISELEVERLHENKVMMEKLRKTLGGTIQVISRAVEMRDPYTAGHQIRVANLARAIGTEMGISADGIDFIRIVSTIHDVGKISVPVEILSKPTKLTNIEFSLIKEHSQAGYDILKNIEFPWPVADVILQHHERMDGSGYPRKLRGNEIMMEARILTVSDVVEAMAWHRPYRPGLGIDAALAEIEKNKGIFYDNTVADACLRLFRQKGFKLETG